MDLENKIKQYKRLKQYKDKSDEEIKKLILKKNTTKVEWAGLDKDEIKYANILYKNYTEKYELTSFSDIEDLKLLIYNQLLLQRIQNELKSLATKHKIPTKNTIDSLNKLQAQILDLKTKLNIGNSKDDNFSDFWKKLKEKANLYSQTHRGECTFVCPNCKKTYLLLMKISNRETFEWKMFKGTYLYNEKLMQLIESKILTVKDVAEIFGCSEDYIDGIYNKIYLKEKAKKNVN